MKKWNELFLSEVGKEVQQRLEGWQNKLDGIEKRFLELSECATSKGKQKGKKRQKVSNDVSSHLSSYAAEVVYDFFLKVTFLGRIIFMSITQ